MAVNRGWSIAGRFVGATVGKMLTGFAMGIGFAVAVKVLGWL